MSEAVKKRRTSTSTHDVRYVVVSVEKTYRDEIINCCLTYIILSKVSIFTEVLIELMM